MPEVTPFQVLIVDDHPLMRRGIRQLLELDPAFYVVAEAGDGASAIDLANRIEPDLILLDLNDDPETPGWCDGANYYSYRLGFRQRHLRADRRDGYLLKDSDPEGCWRTKAQIL